MLDKMMDLAIDTNAEGNILNSVNRTNWPIHTADFHFKSWIGVVFLQCLINVDLLRFKKYLNSRLHKIEIFYLGI